MFSKKFLSIVIACLLSGGMKLSAQIQVGSGGDRGHGADKIKKESMDLFRNSTLIVTIPNKDSLLLGDYEAELNKVWKITPFKVITINKIKEYSNKPNYSFATIGGIEFSTGSSSNSPMSTVNYFKNGASFINDFQYVYEVWMPVPKKMMDVTERLIFARFLLQPDPKSSNAATAKSYQEKTWGRVRFGQGPAVRAYETATFFNMGTGFFKCYFKVFNDGLENGQVINNATLRIPEEKRKLLLKVVNDTLFATNGSQRHLFISAQVKGFVSEKFIEKAEAKDKSKMVDANLKHSFVVKYIDEIELNERIKNTSAPFFFFNFIECGFGKFAYVFEAHSGDIVYQRGDVAMQGFKKDDFYLNNIEKQLEDLNKN